MTPAYRVEIDGKDMTQAWGKALLDLTVTDEAGTKADTLEATFDNREGFSAPPVGSEVKVWIGYEPAPVYRGSYKIDEWEKTFAPRTIRISAKAADLTTNIRANKSRSFHEQTVGSIVSKVAGDHGLMATVDPALASITVDHIDQQTESDVSFLTRLAKRVGGTFKLGDGKVIVAKQGSKSLPSGGEKPKTTLTPNQITSGSMTQGKRGEYRTVSASYMEHEHSKRRTVKAGSGNPKHHIRTLFGSAAEAKAAAQAELGRFARGMQSLDITAPGIPTIFAEGVLVLEGFDPEVDGEFNIKSVRHSIGGHGYSVSISAESGASEAAPEN